MAEQLNVPNAGDRAFKVIIVGAGVSGLTLAHALEKGNIDYVVLEKGVVAPPWGANIAILPNGCRILDQIGCYAAASRQCVPTTGFFNRDSDGTAFRQGDMYPAIERRYVDRYPS